MSNQAQQILDKQRQATLDKPSRLIENKSIRELVSDLKKANGWLLAATIAAFFASSFFVVKYFAGGSLSPQLWTGEQWANAILGLAITAVITVAQAFLYASGYKGPSALIATVILVFFGLFSEISQSMEREDSTVRSRSESSPVFQAALSSIRNMTATASANPYADKIAAAERKVAQCQARGEKHCKGDQATVTSLKAQAALFDQSHTAALNSTISQAKTLEYDEDKHYAMIRLIKGMFGVAGIWASFMFSVIVIGTFEYAFHFVGAYVADHRRALFMLGRDKNGDMINMISDHGTPNATVPQQSGTPEQSNPVRDISRERFLRLIYTEVRSRLINNHLSPTIGAVTTAVTDVISQHSAALGLQPSLIGNPEREKIAEKILEKLHAESVLETNASNGGYELAKRWRPTTVPNESTTARNSNNSTRDTSGTPRNQPTASATQIAMERWTNPHSSGNNALKTEYHPPAPAEITVPVQLQAVPEPDMEDDMDLETVDTGTVNDELYRSYRSAVLSRTIKQPTIRPTAKFLQASGVAGRNQDREAEAVKYIARLLQDGIIEYDPTRKRGDPRGQYKLVGKG